MNGIVHDLSEAEYHRHPALSSTRARLILESPAKFHYRETHPEPPKDSYDLGTAVHTKVLGVGGRIIEYPEEHLTASGNVSTKAATVEWAAEQRASGLTILTPDRALLVDAMAESVLGHRQARELFEQPGAPEASVFGTDPRFNVDMRARFDYLPDGASSNAFAVDLKTTAKSASPERFAKTTADYRYDIQAEWYAHTYEAATGGHAGRMKFVVVETAAPHLVGVYELAPEFLRIARDRVTEALETYARCRDANHWPSGYDDADPLQPPTWLMFMEGDIE